MPRQQHELQQVEQQVHAARQRADQPADADKA
jgi:hypothetical protein